MLSSPLCKAKASMPVQLWGLINSHYLKSSRFFLRFFRLETFWPTHDRFLCWKRKPGQKFPNEKKRRWKNNSKVHLLCGHNVRKLESGFSAALVIGRYYEWSIIYQWTFYNLSGWGDGTSHLPFALHWTKKYSLYWQKSGWLNMTSNFYGFAINKLKPAFGRPLKLTMDELANFEILNSSIWTYAQHRASDVPLAAQQQQEMNRQKGKINAINSH